MSDNEKICTNCKWWGKSINRSGGRFNVGACDNEGIQPLGECDKEVSDGGAGYTFSVTSWVDEFVTHENFGCILWEEKLKCA